MPLETARGLGGGEGPPRTPPGVDHEGDRTGQAGRGDPRHRGERERGERVPGGDSVDLVEVDQGEGGGGGMRPPRWRGKDAGRRDRGPVRRPRFNEAPAMAGEGQGTRRRLARLRARGRPRPLPRHGGDMADITGRRRRRAYVAGSGDIRPSRRRTCGRSVGRGRHTRRRVCRGELTYDINVGHDGHSTHGDGP